MCRSRIHSEPAGALVQAAPLPSAARRTLSRQPSVALIVNSALVILKLRPGEPHGGFEVPVFVPALGALVCAALVVIRVAGGDWRAPALAGGLLAGILVLYFLARVRPEATEDGAPVEP